MAECVVMGAGGGKKVASGIVNTRRFNNDSWIRVDGLDFTPKRVSIIATADAEDVLLADYVDTTTDTKRTMCKRFEYGIGTKIIIEVYSYIIIETTGFSVGPRYKGLSDSYFWIASS